MFGQAFAAAGLETWVWCLYRGYWLLALLCMAAALWLAFAPPRAVLDWVQKRAGVLFRVANLAPAFQRSLAITIDDGPSPPHAHHPRRTLRM
jgi:hypothetical protein